jgi:hypothetical protein
VDLGLPRTAELEAAYIRGWLWASARAWIIRRHGPKALEAPRALAMLAPAAAELREDWERQLTRALAARGHPERHPPRLEDDDELDTDVGGKRARPARAVLAGDIARQAVGLAMLDVADAKRLE